MPDIERQVKAKVVFSTEHAVNEAPQQLNSGDTISNIMHKLHGWFSKLTSDTVDMSTIASAIKSVDYEVKATAAVNPNYVLNTTTVTVPNLGTNVKVLSASVMSPNQYCRVTGLYELASTGTNTQFTLYWENDATIAANTVIAKIRIIYLEK